MTSTTGSQLNARIAQLEAQVAKLQPIADLEAESRERGGVGGGI